MNENLDLVKILKDCPRGTKLYSTMYGEVSLYKVEKGPYPIGLLDRIGVEFCLAKDGRCFCGSEGECTIFPSREQRDWSKFTAPWYKKQKFDPKTLKPFDKVLARLNKQGIWCCEWFSFMEENTNMIKGCGAYYQYCIPYNEDTKHLVGTTEEAPEFYRYWED